jgi:hypothetical protein
MERHGRRVGITTGEECLAVERSGQLPRYKEGHPSLSDQRLKFIRYPRSLSPTLVALPSMSLIPFAPFSFSVFQIFSFFFDI